MRSILALSIVFATATLHAADLELKSLGAVAEGQATKRKFGPYVGVGIGESMGQEGDVKFGGSKYSLDSEDGAAIFSIEVGKSWRMKRFPIMTSLEVEGTFMSSGISGTQDGNAANFYEADMNSLFFNLNGTFALDLWRYRARIGKFAAGFRPYIGGGLGGGQVWFRNASTNVAGQAPFSIDEFVNSWNWHAGLEWSWKDQYSVFAEYRDFHFGDLDDLTGFATDGYVLGFRYRY
jgi:opacity protein-like surface antigen